MDKPLKNDIENQLILVDESDKEIGSCGKLEAHEKALLHRAFSIFVFRRRLVDNPDGTRTFRTELLIQQRAKDKYHSGGLWANSCCSHPRLGESLEEACLRRLPDETGIAVEDCLSSSDSNEAVEGLVEKGALLYKAEFDNGLTEHEYDHVFVGWLKDPESGFTRNPEEADEMKFVDMNWLMKDVLLNSYKYSAWFMPALMIATDGTEFESQNKTASDRIIY